jgi:hypothetical protein
MRSARVEQQPAQHRAEGLGLDGGAEARGDGGGGRVGLLRGDAALLDRERRAVARRPHARRARDRAVLVGGDEPVAVVRQAADPRSTQPRQGDDPFGGLRAPVGEHEALGPEPQRHGLRAQRDAALRHQGADARGDRRPEDVERLALGRDEHQPRVVDARLAQVLGRHERQLVERQGPRHAGRQREGHRAHAQEHDVVEQIAQRRDAGRAGERQRPGHGHVGPRSDGDQERVVVEDVARTVRTRRSPGFTDARWSGRRTASWSAAMRARSKRFGAGAPNGSATVVGRSTRSRPASRRSMRASAPRWWRRAMRASRPATPPPAMTIRDMVVLTVGGLAQGAIRSFPRHRSVARPRALSAYTGPTRPWSSA